MAPRLGSTTCAERVVSASKTNGTAKVINRQKGDKRVAFHTVLSVTMTPTTREKRLHSSFSFSFALALITVLTLSSAASGVNGFDEPIQFIGLSSVLEHAQKVLRLQNPDFTAIQSNLEYYGIAARIPGYLLWTVAKLLAKLIDPFENLGLSAHTGPGLRDAYRSGYFAISHMVSVIYLIGTSIIVNKVTKNWGRPTTNSQVS